MTREIRKSNSQKIVISKSVFQGKEMIDIRIYFYDVDTGEWKPTKKGVSFSPDLAKDVIDGLSEVMQEIAV